MRSFARFVFTSVLAFVLFVSALEPLHACLMLMSKTKGGAVLVGNNEDWTDPAENLFFVPPSSGKYGYVLYGGDRVWPGSGMNDQGLVFDFFRTPYRETRNPEGKPVLTQHVGLLVMEKCATVAEALTILDKHSLGGFEEAQMMIVDKTGDAAIIEGDVIHRKSKPWMIATNFLQSEVPENGEPPCERYRIARKMLAEEAASVESFRRILKATHFEGAWGGTQTSSIFVPDEGVIHLYNFHNYDDSVTLNLRDELARGERSVRISELFPEYFAQGVYEEARPEDDSDLLVEVFRARGAQAALDQAAKIEEGLKQIGPLLAKYFSFDPVTIVDREREWSFAMVAGKHWKIRTFTGGAASVNQAIWKLAAQGEIESAAELMKLAVQRYPDSPRLSYTMAQIYVRAGDKESALIWYDKLAEKYPTDSYWVKELHHNIQRLD